MNLFQMQEVFQQAVSSIVPTNLLTRLIFAVSINGISTAPATGTGIIAGDPESYFFALSNNIVVNQG